MRAFNGYSGISLREVAERERRRILENQIEEQLSRVIFFSKAGEMLRQDFREGKITVERYSELASDISCRILDAQKGIQRLLSIYFYGKEEL